MSMPLIRFGEFLYPTNTGSVGESIPTSGNHCGTCNLPVEMVHLPPSQSLTSVKSWLFFRVARSLRIELDMLVARALKNSQLTCGETKGI
jgi:hypothetical protein